ncbi:MAG: C25 family cysteine peptidase, partial [Bacteroidota bacterium]
SVLASGTWYKLPVPASGVYRITRDLLSAIGADPDAIDPDRIGVYHNGGVPLPVLGGTERPADLVETPALSIGGGDGSFGENDAVILYAEGPRTWAWGDRGTSDPADVGWNHTTNPFTTASYVFIRVDAESPLRVGGATFPGWGDAQPLATVTGRALAERELVNLEREGSGSGLDWLGEEVTRVSGGVTVLDTIPPGLTGDVEYRARVAARARPSITLRMTQGGQLLGEATPLIVNFETAIGRLATTRIIEATSTPTSSLAVTIASPGAPGGATGWLDWVEAVFQRTPEATGGVLAFPTPGGQAGRFEVAMGGFSAAPEAWDVTEPGTVRRLGVEASGGRYRVQFQVDDPLAPREIVAFDPGAPLRAFTGGEAVANQNLHGIASFPDYVMIVPDALRASAERLADHRRAQGLETLVVDVGEVQNEFGGGTMDMRAIRDYMKFLYDRAPDEASL